MGSKRHDRRIIAVSIMGLLLSTYALYVEMAVQSRPGYKALCDLSEHASCSKVLTSEYSKGFGLLPKDTAFDIPNCIYGILYYCTIILLATFDHIAVVRLQFLLSISAVASCFYLAYLLMFVLHDFCVVCVSSYFVNGALAALIYRKMKLLNAKNK